MILSSTSFSPQACAASLSCLWQHLLGHTITCLRYSYRLTLIGFLSRHLIILDTQAQPYKIAIRHFGLQPIFKCYVLLYTTGNVMAMHDDMQSPMVVEKLELIGDGGAPFNVRELLQFGGASGSLSQSSLRYPRVQPAPDR